MTATDLLAQLRYVGVDFYIYGDRLRVDAPAGIITDDLRAALIQYQVELKDLVRREIILI